MLKKMHGLLLSLLIFSSIGIQADVKRTTNDKKSSTVGKSVDIDKQINDLEKSIDKKNQEIEKLQKQIDKLKEKKDEAAPVTGEKTLVLYDLGSGTGKVVIQAAGSGKMEEIKNFIENEYKDVRADISDDERESISRDKMGSPVYGEIKLASFEKLLKDLNLTGRFKKAVGIELSPTRYHHAVAAYERLKEIGPKLPGVKIEFRNESMTECEMQDADVVYMCSTCFPDECMDVLLRNLARLKDGLIVISLKSFPKGGSSFDRPGLEGTSGSSEKSEDYRDYGFVMIKNENNDYTLPMTWSESSPVNVYKLDKSKAKK